MIGQYLVQRLNDLRLSATLCDLELVSSEGSCFPVHHVVFVCLNQKHYDYAKRSTDSSVILHPGRRRMLLSQLSTEELDILVQFMYGKLTFRKSRYGILEGALGKLSMTYLLLEAGGFTLEPDEMVAVKTEAQEDSVEISELPLSNSTDEMCVDEVSSTSGNALGHNGHTKLSEQLPVSEELTDLLKRDSQACDGFQNYTTGAGESVIADVDSFRNKAFIPPFEDNSSSVTIDMNVNDVKQEPADEVQEFVSEIDMLNTSIGSLNETIDNDQEVALIDKLVAEFATGRADNTHAIENVRAVLSRECFSQGLKDSPDRQNTGTLETNTQVETNIDSEISGPSDLENEMKELNSTQTVDFEKFEKHITDKVNLILTATGSISKMLSNLVETKKSLTGQDSGIGCIEKLITKSSTTSSWSKSIQNAEENIQDVTSFTQKLREVSSCKSSQESSSVEAEQHTEESASDTPILDRSVIYNGSETSSVAAAPVSNQFLQSPSKQRTTSACSKKTHEFPKALLRMQGPKSSYNSKHLDEACPDHVNERMEELLKKQRKLLPKPGSQNDIQTATKGAAASEDTTSVSANTHMEKDKHAEKKSDRDTACCSEENAEKHNSHQQKAEISCETSCSGYSSNCRCTKIDFSKPLLVNEKHIVASVSQTSNDSGQVVIGNVTTDLEGCEADIHGETQTNAQSSGHDEEHSELMKTPGLEGTRKNENIPLTKVISGKKLCRSEKIIGKVKEPSSSNTAVVLPTSSLYLSEKTEADGFPVLKRMLSPCFVQRKGTTYNSPMTYSSISSRRDKNEEQQMKSSANINSDEKYCEGRKGKKTDLCTEPSGVNKVVTRCSSTEITPESSDGAQIVERLSIRGHSKVNPVLLMSSPMPACDLYQGMMVPVNGGGNVFIQHTSIPEKKRKRHRSTASRVNKANPHKRRKSIGAISSKEVVEVQEHTTGDLKTVGNSKLSVNKPADHTFEKSVDGMQILDEKMKLHVIKIRNQNSNKVDVDDEHLPLAELARKEKRCHTITDSGLKLTHGESNKKAVPNAQLKGVPVHYVGSLERNGMTEGEEQCLNNVRESDRHEHMCQDKLEHISNHGRFNLQSVSASENHTNTVPHHTGDDSATSIDLTADEGNNSGYPDLSRVGIPHVIIETPVFRREALAIRSPELARLLNASVKMVKVENAQNTEKKVHIQRKKYTAKAKRISFQPKKQFVSTPGQTQNIILGNFRTIYPKISRSESTVVSLDADKAASKMDKETSKIHVDNVQSIKTETEDHKLDPSCQQFQVNTVKTISALDSAKVHETTDQGLQLKSSPKPHLDHCRVIKKIKMNKRVVDQKKCSKGANRRLNCQPGNGRVKKKQYNTSKETSVSTHRTDHKEGQTEKTAINQENVFNFDNIVVCPMEVNPKACKKTIL